MVEGIGRAMADAMIALAVIGAVVGAVGATLLIFVGPWALRGLRALLNALPL